MLLLALVATVAVEMVVSVLMFREARKERTL